MDAAQVKWNLERLVRGHADAAAWLFDTFGETLFRRLKRRYEYPGGADAEDLMQDAFVFFLQHDAKVLRDFLDRVPEQEQDAARLDRHLWDLACGVASNRRRSQRRRRDGEELPEDGALSDGAATPENEAMGKEQLRMLETCLSGAGEKVFLYYKLRFVDGFTPSEIGEMTRWSMKTTYRLRQRLDDALRKCAHSLGLEHWLPKEPAEPRPESE